MNRRLSPLALLFLLLALLGCSGSRVRGGPDAGAGASGCGLCDGSRYVPCGPQGEALAPVECAPKACFNGKGCVTCRPGESTCMGNGVGVCGDDGELSGGMSPCDTAGGELCAQGRCRSACEAVSMEPTNMGCEFWAVDLDNEYSPLNDAAGAPWGVVLAKAGFAPAQVKIERNDSLPGQAPKLATVKSLTVAPGSLQMVPLPTRELDGSKLGKDDGPGTWLSANAYKITSTAPLVAYQFNPLEQMFSNDASLLIPTNGLGTVYRVLGFPTANPIGFPGIPGIPDHSFVTVVGVTANTQVTVTLGGPIVAGGTIPARAKGGKITATLGPFEVLNLESDGIPGDLTGTVVTASAPVAVFTGGERGIAPLQSGPAGAAVKKIYDPPPIQ